MHFENWFLKNKRSFPWREETTPYRVWISEVMLQQTRAQVVIAYFQRWMKQFPTVQALSDAPLEDVIKAWEGLGYYSRARNLHAGAQMIIKVYDGIIPSTRDELLKIPGLGPYTAGAILSFGFRKKAVAIDGNVARVVTRFAWIDEEIGKSSTKRKIESFVEGFLHPEQPWVTTEALIELGATICTPVPRCAECPIQQDCAAFARRQPTALPIKLGGPKIEKIVRGIAVVECQGQILLRKTPAGRIMADLWEFPYFESIRGMISLKGAIERWLGVEATYISKMAPVEHSFTRFSAQLYPFRFQISDTQGVEGFQWIPIEKLRNLPFSSGHRKILQQM